MCWSSKKAPKPHIGEAVKVFKIVKIEDGKYYPYFQRFPEYRVNERYYSSISLRIIYDYIREEFQINHGFHSYGYDVLVLTGFDHARVEIPGKGSVIYNDLSNLAIAHCIIPQCRLYFVNEDKEYVSEALFIEKITPLKDYVLDK